MKDVKNRECKGYCWLNITGYMDIWEIVCNKCNGTTKEKELIDSTLQNSNKKVDVIGSYNFTEEEKEKLKGEWY